MTQPYRRRWAGWWVAALTVIFFGAGLAVLLRPPAPDVPPPTKPKVVPKVGVARLDEGSAGRLLREQATIFDPTPLFLPTKWNAGQQPLPASVEHQPGQVFHSFRPQLVFEKSSLHLPIPRARVLPKSPIELLKQPTRDPFLGFDRRDQELVPLPARYGIVEVLRVEDGKLVFSQELNKPIVAADKSSNWQPLEFLAVVTVTGLLGRPVMLPMEGLPGNAATENMVSDLRHYLSADLHLGERLEPGTYRVVVGP